jgi:hypothetical protein
MGEGATTVGPGVCLYEAEHSASSDAKTSTCSTNGKMNRKNAHKQLHTFPLDLTVRFELPDSAVSEPSDLLTLCDWKRVACALRRGMTGRSCKNIHALKRALGDPQASAHVIRVDLCPLPMQKHGSWFEIALHIRAACRREWDMLAMASHLRALLEQVARPAIATACNNVTIAYRGVFIDAMRPYVFHYDAAVIDGGVFRYHP